MEKLPLILASSSAIRKNLLAQIGINPDKSISPDIDETAKKNEKSSFLAVRLAEEKAAKVSQIIDNGIILAADTVVVCRGRVLGKAETDEDVRRCLKLSSGYRNRIYTGVAFVKKENAQTVSTRKRLSTSIIKYKPLTTKEIDKYISTREGIGKSGAVAIDGYAASFISWMQGSFSGIMGLPLFETKNMLISLGHDFTG